MSSKPLTNSVSIDAELADHLEQDPEFRLQYIRTFAQAAVASEIRSLRKLRKLKQAEVALRIGTGQSAISRIERADYDGWTFKTLLSIAIELHARLRIQLEPIEDVVDGYRNPESQLVAGSSTGSFETAGDTGDVEYLRGSVTMAELNEGSGTSGHAWVQ